ncbi:MAG: GNAT family N-acetyltransferase [Ruthenibacterium lactatiformans]
MKKDERYAAETTAPREAGPILCRFMRETDVPACAALKPARTTAGAKPHCAKSWRRKTRACLLRSRRKVAGLAVFQLVCGGQAYAVSTAPAFRRQGVARALLSWAFAALCLQGAQDVFLEVRPEQRRAGAVPLARLCADGPAPELLCNARG